MSGPGSRTHTPGAEGDAHRARVQYPGGLAARYRWAGSGQAGAVFATSEVGGAMVDLGPRVAADPDRLCRAELRVEGPLGIWTVRFASPIFDQPQGLLWDVPGLLVVKYGFAVYALAGRTGELCWDFASRTPLLAVVGSARLPHVVAQAEIETTALDETGGVVWRTTHSDVVTDVELVGGRLVLTGYSGAMQSLDPLTGRSVA